MQYKLLLNPCLKSGQGQGIISLELHLYIAATALVKGY
jgi:hypothetical protein